MDHSLVVSWQMAAGLALPMIILYLVSKINLVSKFNLVSNVNLVGIVNLVRKVLPLQQRSTWF